MGTSAIEVGQALLTEERENEAALLLSWARQLPDNPVRLDVYLAERRQKEGEGK